MEVPDPNGGDRRSAAHCGHRASRLRADRGINQSAPGPADAPATPIRQFLTRRAAGRWLRRKTCIRPAATAQSARRSFVETPRSSATSTAVRRQTAAFRHPRRLERSSAGIRPPAGVARALHELTATRNQNVAAGLLLQPRDLVNDVAAQDRRVVPRRRLQRLNEERPTRGEEKRPGLSRLTRKGRRGGRLRRPFKMRARPGE